MSLPAIRIIRGPSPTQKGLADAATGGLSSVLSAGSVAVDLMPHEREDLLVFLTNRSVISRMAKHRARHVLGRLYNRFSGDDPDYVELSGVHLGQALTVVGRAIPEVVVADGDYKLRLDIVLEAVDRLRGELRSG